MVYSGMASRVQREGVQRAVAIVKDLALEIKRLRMDAGVSQRALGRAAGVDQSVISRIEASLEAPSIETCARLDAALGADLSMRLFPNTGPAIHDRHQARIVEALIRDLDGRWQAWPEVGVLSPVRGWIDIVLVDRLHAMAVATKVESTIHRLEQAIRWSNAKADALDSSRVWPFGITGQTPSISRLLILRATRTNRELAASFAETFRAAYPGDPRHALASLRGTSTWPGGTLLWAVDRRGGIAIAAAPPATNRLHPRGSTG